MTDSKHDLIISGVHLELTDALKEKVKEKMEKLFVHESHIIRIRVELEYNANTTRQKEFIAKGHIEIHGPTMVACVETEDLYRSIDLLAQKLDRMLRRRSRLRKVKRNHPHHVDIPAEIPKTSL
jgi:putative sigma-54 modulation protein